MKPRIKIDTTILFVMMILTGFLWRVPCLYPKNIFLQEILDFVGLWMVLAGTFFRMAARAHKKARSDHGHGLVTTGPYAFIRNPMYLGTFLIGSGFILMVWPWYLLPLFAALFFLRFNVQIQKEESHLQKIFGKSYEAYAHKVSGIFPRFSDWKRVQCKDIFPLKEMWGTKEKYTLWWTPVLALSLELIQQRIVFGAMNIGRSVFVFSLSVAIFGLAIWLVFKR